MNIKKEMEKNNKKMRVEYFDYLRVFAIIAVIVLHVAAQNWYTTYAKGFTWQVFNFFDSIARWGVPIFIMLSGALFLNRDIPIKQLYKKYILRLVIAFLIWSTIYMLFSPGDMNERIKMVIEGHYHMWFIPTIIGLYMFVPIFKLIIQNKKIMEYFLLLAFIFSFFIPTVYNILKDFFSENLIKLANLLHKCILNMNINIVMSYGSYYVLGYCLFTKEFTKKTRIIIYILGIIGFISTIVLSSAIVVKTNIKYSYYYNSFSIGVLFESIAIFVWFKYHNFNKLRINNLFVKLSNYSFGVYLVHALIIEEMNKLFELNTLSFNPILSVISIVSLTVFISFLISTILHSIPFVKKYMV